MLLKARAKNEMKIAMLILGRATCNMGEVDMIKMYSLEYICVQLTLHNHRELQRSENERPQSRDEHIHN
jgi:hypothetical protein